MEKWHSICALSVSNIPLVTLYCNMDKHDKHNDIVMRKFFEIFRRYIGAWLKLGDCDKCVFGKSFAFWDNECDDIYTQDDGEPVD